MIDFAHNVSAYFSAQNPISFAKKKGVSREVPLPKFKRFGMNWRRDRSIHAGRTQASMSLNNEVMPMAKTPPKKAAAAKAAPAPKKAAPKKAAPKKK
jgi:hypothetical protein